METIGADVLSWDLGCRGLCVWECYPFTAANATCAVKGAPRPSDGDEVDIVDAGDEAAAENATYGEELSC